MYEWVLPLVVGVISLAISAFLFDVFLKRRRMHHLLWAVGMLLWSVSDFTQLYALVLGWTVAAYLAYYFCSIMLAGFLGSGTLYLIAPKSRVSGFYMWFNIVAAAALVVALLVVPVDAAALKAAVAGANGIVGPSRDIAALVNIPAAVTFIGGAAYSFVRTRKLYALLITVGALIPAIGGSLATAAIPQLLPFTDFFGILFLGMGFYLSFGAIHRKGR